MCVMDFSVKCFSSFMAAPVTSEQQQQGVFMPNCFHFLFLVHLKNQINSSGTPLACSNRNENSYLIPLFHPAYWWYLPSPHIHLMAPPASLNPCLPLTHLKLHEFVHRCEKSHFLSWLDVASGCSSECQLNSYCLLMWAVDKFAAC